MYSRDFVPQQKFVYIGTIDTLYFNYMLLTFIVCLERYKFGWVGVKAVVAALRQHKQHTAVRGGRTYILGFNRAADFVFFRPFWATFGRIVLYL